MLCGLLKREAHLFKSCAQSCCPADTEVKLTISSPGPCLQDLQGFLLAVIQRKRHQVHDQASTGDSVWMWNPRAQGSKGKRVSGVGTGRGGGLGGIMFSITHTSPISASNLGKQNNFGPPRSICLWNGLSALLNSEAF